MTELFLITNTIIVCLGAIATQRNTNKSLKKILTGISILALLSLIVFFSSKALYYLNN